MTADRPGDGPSPKGIEGAEADAPGPPGSSDEAAAVRERYARRAEADPRYSLFNPAALAAFQERQRALLRLFEAHGLTDLRSLRLLEVGCGSGANLLEFLRFGFAPANLAGIELLRDRHAAARACLVPAVALHLGDATAEAGAGIEPASLDIVYQATVFSSLLDDAFQQRLADRMWRWVRPGGGVLWYDFTVDNPRNADVRGVPLRRVRQLFPEARIDARRVTLAPPIARAVAPWHRGLYGILNIAPLRTHVLAWIARRS